MRTTLYLKLIALDTYDFDKYEQDNVWYLLAKDIRMPFVPYIGLKLVVPGLVDSHPDAEKWRVLFEQSPEPEMGVFTIESVQYDLKQKCFQVYQDRTFPEMQAMQEVIEQLIIGYGFMQTWPIADERIDANAG